VRVTESNGRVTLRYPSPRSADPFSHRPRFGQARASPTTASDRQKFEILKLDPWDLPDHDMVRAHLKQTVSFYNPQICRVPLQPHPDNHRTIVAGPTPSSPPPVVRFPSARRQEESDGEEESGNWIMALQDQRV